MATTFVFASTDNKSFNDYIGKKCKLGTDGKHAKLSFDNGKSITTSSVVNCYLSDVDVKYAGLYIETRHSIYDLWCADENALLRAFIRLKDVADSNRLSDNALKDVQSGADLGEALAHAISDQVKGHHRVMA